MGDFDLTGRVAVVTGAGRGIGKGIARTFADAEQMHWGSVINVSSMASIRSDAGQGPLCSVRDCGDL